MQIDTINKYLIENTNGENVLTIHKMGTKHKESIERFVLNEDKYILMNEGNFGSKDSKLKMLLNPSKNIGERDVVTHYQYIQLLVFYGLIDFRIIEENGGFEKIRNSIREQKLKIEVDCVTEKEFYSRISLVPGNIISQFYSEDQSIAKNAKHLLSTITLFSLFKKRNKSINEENLDEILMENNWKIKGVSGGYSELSQTVRELRNFEDTPFGNEINMFEKIAREIVFPER